MVLKNENQEIKSHHPGTVTTAYSDNGGLNWYLGETVPAGDVFDPNESTVVELEWNVLSEYQEWQQ